MNCESCEEPILIVDQRISQSYGGRTLCTDCLKEEYGEWKPVSPTTRPSTYIPPRKPVSKVRAEKLPVTRLVPERKERILKSHKTRTSLDINCPNCRLAQQLGALIRCDACGYGVNTKI